MNSDFAVSPMLPLLAQLPATVVLTLLLLFALRLAGSTSARFVVFAVWFRFMLSAFHDYTFDQIAAGLSLNALASASVFLLGLSLLRIQLLLSKALMPVYFLMALIPLSAIANGAVQESFETLVKFGYFIVIALHSFQALRSGDSRRFSIALLMSFAPLLLFQVMSLALGVYKISASDGEQNYIGGYYHEAAFSVGLVGLFVATALSRGIGPAVKTTLLVVALIGILLANYRTAMLGTIPLVLYYLTLGTARLFHQQLRPVVVATVAVGLIIVGGTALVAMERFSELRSIATGEAELLKPPEEFTTEDQRLLTGRAYIWSTYYDAWKHDGGEVQHLIGMGPDSWQGRFNRYAHNSFVSFLFEYGIIGVAGLLLFLGTGLVMSAQTSPGERAKLLAAHISFLLLNLATMPIWQIEGLILYGIMWGFTMESYYRRRTNIEAPLVHSPMAAAAR